MDNIGEIVREGCVAFSEMRKNAKYLDSDEYVLAVSDNLYRTMHSQIHGYLAQLRDNEGEDEIRKHIEYVCKFVLPTLRDKLKKMAVLADKLKKEKFTEENKARLLKLQENYTEYGKLYENFYALSAFRNIEHFALYMEWGMPENDKVWKYNLNCFKGFWYYADKMVLDGTVKYLEKQCPVGYGKSFADTVLISYIFGIDINADVLKIVGNPSLITDMSAKLVKYMCKPNYAKVFPYYAQFEGDKDKIFDVRREGGNNQVARLLIHGSIKGTSFLLANKDTPVDGGRYKYRFYDDITRSKDKGNINMHEKDIERYQDQWKKRRYDDNNSFEVFSGTTYHIYDFLSTIKRKYGGDTAKQSKINKYTKFNARYKAVFVSVPKLDWDTDESTYPHKYTTEEARSERLADYNTFMAMDMQEPMPIEGCAFSYDNLLTYKAIPHIEEEKDEESCWAMLDPARTGANYIAMAICLPIGDKHYLKDCIFEMKPMEKIYPTIIRKIEQHHITRLHIERNTDTSLATLLRGMLYERGIDYCNITEVYSYKHKEDKIYDNEAAIKSCIVFPEFGMYAQGSEFGKFMKYLTSFSYTVHNAYDDSIDVIAMYAQKYLSFKKRQNSITILNRRRAN
jgi:predicted phage terminase large subunit-like protein